MELCRQCPRYCGVNRKTGHGFCGEGEEIRVCRAAAHYWEEPCISGVKGSGAVFFAGCNLKCVFCQNASISRGGYGKVLSETELALVLLRLQDEGVHNINLVTPSHFTDAVRRALFTAKDRGLSIPVVWNSSGYECAEAIRGLKGLVDVYMPDFKYLSAELSRRYSGTADYFEVARAAVDEMVLQKGETRFKDGIMTEGVIVRHLVLPACTADSKAVLRFLHRRYGEAIYLSVMKQYTPMAEGLPDELGRPLSDEEYREVTDYALKIGISRGFFQEGDSVGKSFIPEFDLRGV